MQKALCWWGGAWQMLLMAALLWPMLVLAAADGRLELSAGHVAESECLGCHAEQAARHARSHHAQAMLPASDDSVRARFPSSYQGPGPQADFLREDGRFLVDTMGPDGQGAGSGWARMRSSGAQRTVGCTGAAAFIAGIAIVPTVIPPQWKKASIWSVANMRPATPMSASAASLAMVQGRHTSTGQKRLQPEPWPRWRTRGLPRRRVPKAASAVMRVG